MNIRLLHNYVLVLPNRDNDELLLKNGHKLFLDISYDKEKHAVTEGVVLRVPQKLLFGQDYQHESMMYDVDMEVKEGDTVIFHYMSLSSAIKEGKFVDMEGRKAYLIRYDKLFCAVRSEQIIMLNGVVLVEPVSEETKTTIELPDMLKDRRSEKKGIVRYVGSPVHRYLMYPDLVPEQADDVKPGDRVTFSSVDAIPLQYELHRNNNLGNLFYRMRRKDVTSILN